MLSRDFLQSLNFKLNQYIYIYREREREGERERERERDNENCEASNIYVMAKFHKVKQKLNVFSLLQIINFNKLAPPQNDWTAHKQNLITLFLLSLIKFQH